MNNNANFDPITGQPLQNNQQILNNAEQVNQPTIEQATIVTEPKANQQSIDQPAPVEQIQSQLQNIPTVEQNKQDFINNVQSMNQQKKEEKKEGVNFVFIIILFVVILVVIYFLFPILLNYI